MNTHISGRKVLIQKSQEEVFSFLSQPANFHSIMPDDVQRFESGDDWFIFELKGIPAVKLKVDQTIPSSKIVLKSASDKLNFELVGSFEKDGDHTQGQLDFNGEFNAMLKMMVTKPLTNFLNKLSDKLELL